MPAPRLAGGTIATIFINYRREDTSGYARGLCKDLRSRLRSARIFMDLNIEPGADFTAVISDQIAACDVQLALIGKHWTKAVDEQGRRRIEDPADFVRSEIEGALLRKVRVIPVLVQGARMPGEQDVPPSLRPMLLRQAFELSDKRWEQDVDELAKLLRAHVAGAPEGAPEPAADSPKVPEAAPPARASRRLLPIGVLVLALAAAGVFAFLKWGGSSPELSVLLGAAPVSRSPQYSPDGLRIAYQSNKTGFPEIWTADRNGSNEQRLTDFNGPLVGSPRWSADGRQIAFDARTKADADIWIVPATGGTRRQVTTESSNEVRPSWSHDGRWIYFGSDRGGQKWQIWKVAVETGRSEQVSRNGREAFEAPDGRSVFYAFDDADGIWNAPADGTPETRVTEVGRQGLWGVAKSGLVFLAGAGAARHLAFYDFRTGRQSRLAGVSGGQADPMLDIAVAPDLESVLLAAGTDERSAILQLPLRK